MNKELLEKHFDPRQIKQREGNFGKKLDYVEAHAVIQRLNDAFESEWSLQIIKHEILKDSDEVIVLGELKAGDIVKTQFGSRRIRRAKETGNIISIAPDKPVRLLQFDASKAIAGPIVREGLSLFFARKDTNVYRVDVVGLPDRKRLVWKPQTAAVL